MKKFVKKYWPQLVLSVIVVILAVLNYRPGTFLSGWDTLHPEFNFGLNFYRLIEGVWREEQGLGALAGHSHMADLPRVFILWLLHFALPMNLLRYSYIFLCLLIGPLGIFSLVNYLFKHKSHRATIIAFLAALFYLFNLSTLQQFYVPFEMFPTQYAYLPWVVLFTLKFLHSGNKKSLLWFTVFTLLATPQAYAAHLWYAFFGVYLLFLIAYCWFNRGTKHNVKKSLVLIVFTLVVNSFWLLPNIYYVFSSSQVPREAKQNRLYSQEYRLRNREHGYLKDVSVVKGFYFNWTIYNFDKNRFEYLMDDWRKHLDNPYLQAVGYLLFSGVILGVILSFLRKDKIFMSLSPLLFVPFILLLNHTFPFDKFFEYLLRFPLFEEALRFVFTKFSILLLFAYTLYLAYFLAFLFSKLKKSFYIKLLSLVFILLVLSLCLPFFQGKLISDKMRIRIPQEYFEMWSFMNRQPDGTVLSLPLHNFAGWSYYDWGYQGAGFIWFGLKQPILERDSDRWSVANEQAFRESRFSIYSRNTEHFTNDLKKYNIQYLLWDNSAITYSEKNRRQIVYQREIQELIDILEKQGQLTKIAQFNKLRVYKVVGERSPAAIITSAHKFLPYRWGFNDYAYAEYGNYISTSQDNTVIYPFRAMVEPTDRIKRTSFDEFAKTEINEGSLNLGAETLFALNQHRSKIELKKDDNLQVLYFENKNFQTGIHIDLSGLKHETGYFLVFKSKNVEGMPLRFCLLNLYSNLCDLYDELSENKAFAEDYFYVPPSENSFGYGLSIDNISYGDYSAINELSEVKIIAVPIDLTSIKTVEKMPDSSPTRYLLLQQGYHPGWIAYDKGKSLTNHVLINNWANGWPVDEQTELQDIELVFWPQRLEYIGFGLLLISFLTFILMRRKLL